MPALIKILTRDGLQPADYAADTLHDAAQHEPEYGVYTVANTFHRTQVLKLDAHLDRLEDSARRANIALNLNRPKLRAALRSMIEEANFGDVRFRITVAGEQPDRFILSIEPFSPVSAETIAKGVRGVTAANSARSNAAAKTTNWMHARESLTHAMPPGIYETFLLNTDGFIMEGTGSNFYAVMDGELRTAGEGVLAGIAQQIVFEIAGSIIPVRRAAVHVSDIPRLSEAFLTSSSRGIVPVVELDRQPVGQGIPGETTLALRQAYLAWMQSHLEEL